MEKEVYLDANIFLYASLSKDKKGQDARAFLGNLNREEITAFTSTLTFDEVFWKIKRERNHELALKGAKALLNFPNIRFIDVDFEAIKLAYNLLKKYSLDPRDAIHAACAIIKKIPLIITEDSDFKIIQEIKSKWI